MDKIRVLFLCTGNSARSQMAEGFLRKLGGDRFEAFSAGLEPKGIHPLTLKAMEEEGINLKEHRSKSLNEYLGNVYFSYVITVCQEADRNCPAVFPGAVKRLNWEFEDPAAFNSNEDEKIYKFRQVRDQIKAQIKNWIEQS